MKLFQWKHPMDISCENKLKRYLPALKERRYHATNAASFDTHWCNKSQCQGSCSGTAGLLVQLHSGAMRINRALLESIRACNQECPDQPSEEQLKADSSLCRFILVFDREGYSPKLFKDLWEKYRIG